MKKVVAEITYHEGALFHQGVTVTKLVEADVLEDKGDIIKIGWGEVFADCGKDYAHECWIKKDKIIQTL